MLSIRVSSLTVQEPSFLFVPSLYVNCHVGRVGMGRQRLEEKGQSQALRIEQRMESHRAYVLPHPDCMGSPERVECLLDQRVSEY